MTVNLGFTAPSIEKAMSFTQGPQRVYFIAKHNFTFFNCHFPSNWFFADGVCTRNKISLDLSTLDV